MDSLGDCGVCGLALTEGSIAGECPECGENVCTTCWNRFEQACVECAEDDEDA